MQDQKNSAIETKEATKSARKQIKSKLTFYEALQFTQLTSEQTLASMNIFFCRNFMLLSAFRIMAFLLILVAFQNFQVLQISGIVIV